jgi:hypothetical protein
MSYAHPVAWGAGELPYRCDTCQAPAVAVRAGEPDLCWCQVCWSARYAVPGTNENGDLMSLTPP